MKRSLSLLLTVFLLASCDLMGTSSDTDSDGTGTETITIAPPTEDQLVGTWEQTITFTDGSITTQIALNGDGSYTKLMDLYSDPDHYYSATKGIYNIDTTGYYINLIETHYAYNITEFSLDENVTWNYYDPPNPFKYPVIIIDNQLYMGNFFFAEGTTSGIVGTWSFESEETEWDDTANKYVTTYYKDMLTFEADGDYSLQSYESTTPNDYGTPYQEYGTYSYSNGTLTITPSGGTTSSGKVAVYDNVLIMGSETSASAHAYIKQP